MGALGYNVTETVGAMMKLISSATPEQLAELSNLLERDAKRLPHPATKSAAVSEPAAPPRVAEPEPADEKPDVPPLDSDPDRPVEQPAAPATKFELDRPGIDLLCRQPRSQLDLWNDPLCRRRRRSRNGLLQNRTPWWRACRTLARRICLLGASRLSN